MKIALTPAARAYLQEQGADTVTVTSLVFTSCCSGPLPPEVKPGPPADPDGFAEYRDGDVRVLYDSLLDPRDELVIDLKDYGAYKELLVKGWE